MAKQTPPDRFAVFSIRKQASGEAVWIRAGSAFKNKDGSINVMLDVLPLDGKLHLREAGAGPSPDADKPEPEGGAIRLKVTDGNRNVSYLEQASDGRWHYFNKSGTPLALSNCTTNAAELEFALRDAVCADAALRTEAVLAAMRKYIYSHYSVEVVE